MLPESVMAGALAPFAFLLFIVRSAKDSRKLSRHQGVAELPAALLVPGHAGLNAFALVRVACPALYLLGRIDLLT